MFYFLKKSNQKIAHVFKLGLWIRIQIRIQHFISVQIRARIQSLNPDPMRIRIHNITLEDKIFSSSIFYNQY
jgi:hypothetical protein